MALYKVWKVSFFNTAQKDNMLNASKSNNVSLLKQAERVLKKNNGSDNKIAFTIKYLIQGFLIKKINDIYFVIRESIRWQIKNIPKNIDKKIGGAIFFN